MKQMLTLSILFIWVCTSCGASPTQPPNPTLAPATATPAPAKSTPTNTITPTPTHLSNAIPALELNSSTFHFYAENPVLQQSNNPNWDNLYIDPGGMVYYQGQFHMFYNGINGFPAPVGVGYATSPDGYHWTRQVSEPVLTPKGMSTGKYLGTNFFVTSALVEDDGTWVLYFYTLKGGTFNGPGEIGRATAPAPTGPWTIDPAPILNPGPDGAWDDVAPDVLKIDKSYIMYYDGHGYDSTSLIGMATSSDGIHWTKYNDPATTDPAFAESDPVLTVSKVGWDSTRVIDPNVIKTSDGWKMIYLATVGTGKFSGGGFAFGSAHSPDGMHWSKSAQNPVLSNKDHAHWSATYLATLLHIEDTYYLYFDFATSSVNGTNVYLATFTGPLN